MEAFLISVVNDGDYLKNGELYLNIGYEGIELDVKYLEKVLPYIHQLWGRTVIWKQLWKVRTMCFPMMGRGFIGNICDGKNGHRMVCPFFFFYMEFLFTKQVLTSMIIYLHLLHKLILLNLL